MNKTVNIQNSINHTLQSDNQTKLTHKVKHNYSLSEITKYIDMKIDELTISASKSKNVDFFWSKIIILNSLKKDFQLNKPKIYFSNKKLHGW